MAVGGGEQASLSGLRPHCHCLTFIRKLQIQSVCARQWQQMGIDAPLWASSAAPLLWSCCAALDFELGRLKVCILGSLNLSRDWGQQNLRLAAMTSPSSTSATPWGDSLFSWLVQPNSDVYYPGIAVIYTIASFIALGLYGWEKFLMARPPTEFQASLDGLYLVLMPYVPGLVWVLSMKQRIPNSNNQQAVLSTSKGKQDWIVMRNVRRIELGLEI